MKQVLTKVFWPILKFFESGQESQNYNANYKKSHRVALNVVGALFICLSLGSAGAVRASGDLGGLVPMLVFFCVGLVAVVVGTLGSNAAVSKIWGSK